MGLKGTDHVAQEALRRGAVPHAGERTCQALQALAQTAVPFQVVTWPGAMGGDAAQSLGLPCRLLPGVPQGESTRGEDTQALAKALAEEGVDLILFCLLYTSRAWFGYGRWDSRQIPPYCFSTGYWL